MSHEMVHGRWVARFRARGVGRFFEAGFLLFWLCGWAVGEILALGALVAIALSYVPAGTLPFPPIPFKTEPGFSLIAAVFLGVWLTFWTLGGVMAIRETLRALWSSDEIQWDGAGLTVIRRIGPFVTQREIPADQVLGIRDTLPHSGLSVTVEKGSVELTRLGTREERGALEQALRSAFPGRKSAPAADALPDDWHSILDSSGEHVLSMAPRHARTRAIVSWIVGGVLIVTGISILAGGVGADASASETALRLLGLIPFLAGVAAILFFALGGSEIHVRNGSMTFVRRVLHHEWARVVTVGVIQVGFDRDSDGDARFTLFVQSEGRRRTVASTLHDPAELVVLGRWLAARTQRPLELAREVADLT